MKLVRSSVARGLAVLLLATMAAGCEVVDTQRIRDTVQGAIDQVSAQSDAWRAALPDLVNRLNDLESQASGDVRTTINDTVNEVSLLSNQTLSMAEAMAKDTVAFTLIQAQCSVDYFKSSVVSYLKYLKARVSNHSAPAPAKRVCNFNPDRVDVDPTQLAGSNRTWLIQVYGYNFVPGALPAVELHDGTDRLVRESANEAVRTSLYQMQLQLVAADLTGVAAGYRIELAWPDHDRNAISVNISTPAHLEALALDMPATVTVNQAVVPRLTVRNSGTVDSGTFTIKWTPDTATGRVVTQSELSLAGGQTRVYDLPAFTYLQRDYFDLPRTAPITGMQTIVQILSNTGVGTNTQQTRGFTLANLPFHNLPVITITNPNVGAPWTSYQQIVGVRPGDIVTVDAGGCVQTGGSGDTWKRYVNPDASDAPNKYHGLVQIQPGPSVRLLAIIGTPMPVRLSNRSPEFRLGYEDSDYSDNGYWGHDDGTHDQCAGVFGAFVNVTIARN